MDFDTTRYYEIEKSILNLIQDFQDTTSKNDYVAYTNAVNALKRKVFVDNIQKYDPNIELELTDKDLSSLKKMKTRFRRLENNLSNYDKQQKSSNDYQRMYLWLLDSRNQLNIEHECKSYCWNKKHSET